MATFILVHGAWGGAHGFRHVRKLLRANGHEVTTPCLSGIGERVHLAIPLVNLSTHVQDLVNHLLYEDINDIALVGFSYGGFVITGALEHIAARVKHLVFLDAFVPKNGDSVMGLTRGVGRSAITLGEDWQVPGPQRRYDDPAEAEWMSARRTSHPKGCFTETVYLSQPLESFPFTRTFIKATASSETDPGEIEFRRAARHAQDSDAWRYFEVPTNHMVANNKPEELAMVLALIAAQVNQAWERSLPTLAGLGQEQPLISDCFPHHHLKPHAFPPASRQRRSRAPQLRPHVARLLEHRGHRIVTSAEVSEQGDGGDDLDDLSVVEVLLQFVEIVDGRLVGNERGTIA